MHSLEGATRASRGRPGLLASRTSTRCLRPTRCPRWVSDDQRCLPDRREDYGWRRGLDREEHRSADSATPLDSVRIAPHAPKKAVTAYLNRAMAPLGRPRTFRGSKCPPAGALRDSEARPLRGVSSFSARGV